MNNWPGIQITLENVFSSSLGIPFVWDDEPRMLMAKPFGVLSLGNCISVGRDFATYTFSHSDISLDLIGQRELTIGVQIFSRSNNKSDKSACYLIEKARLILANPCVKDELKSAGLIFVENHPVTHLDFTFQNRAEKRSAFDVVFRLCLNENLPNNKTFFESIQIAGDI